MCTLIIAGAGGHGQVCADIASRLALFDDVVFSDNAYERGMLRGPWTVQFHDEDLPTLDFASYRFILGIGQLGTGRTREMLFNRIGKTGIAPTVLVAPQASVAEMSAVGPGTLIGSNSTVNIGAAMGKNVIVNTHAVVEHDATIGDHVHLSTGVIINGGARVGERCLIGSGTIVLQGVTICGDVVIGAGSVVTRDIKSPGTYVGVPARKIHD